MTLEIYTDGSCLNNPGPGGWAYIYVQNNEIISEAYGSHEDTTNNKMELKAILQALTNCPDTYTHKVLYTDSMYAVNGITKWLPQWKSRKFKNVKNDSLWKNIDSMLNSSLEVYHVKAHSTNKWNNHVDSLAFKQAKLIL
jgi:ribonuclease HI